MVQDALVEIAKGVAHTLPGREAPGVGYVKLLVNQVLNQVAAQVGGNRVVNLPVGEPAPGIGLAEGRRSVRDGYGDVGDGIAPIDQHRRHIAFVEQFQLVVAKHYHNVRRRLLQRDAQGSDTLLAGVVAGLQFVLGKFLFNNRAVGGCQQFLKGIGLAVGGP